VEHADADPGAYTYTVNPRDEVQADISGRGSIGEWKCQQEWYRGWLI